MSGILAGGSMKQGLSVKPDRLTGQLSWGGSPLSLPFEAGVIVGHSTPAFMWIFAVLNSSLHTLTAYLSPPSAQLDLSSAG